MAAGCCDDCRPSLEAIYNLTLGIPRVGLHLSVAFGSPNSSSRSLMASSLIGVERESFLYVIWVQRSLRVVLGIIRRHLLNSSDYRSTGTGSVDYVETAEIKPIDQQSGLKQR